MSKSKKNEKKFNLEEFISKSKTDKKSYILSEAEEIKIPKGIKDKKLRNAYKYKEVINKFIKDYILEVRKPKENEIKNNQILEKINFFKENYNNKKLPEKLAETPKNLFQMSGAKDFYSMQLVLRSITTTLGNFWEELATLSNNAISTEKEFGIKIKGVDIICINNDKPTYIQMKTMEGTLTGSQVSRSEEELLIHKNSYFAAVFETGSSWTFNSDKIKKIKGNEFWSIINLDYNYILKEVKLMVKEIEDKFHELTKPKN